MILKIENVKKTFGDVTALRGVSLEAHSGRPFGLLGRNGVGKTTLIRIIMGVFPPDGGTLLLDGRSRGPGKAQAFIGVPAGMAGQGRETVWDWFV